MCRADRAAVELLDQRLQELPVERLEPELVDSSIASVARDLDGARPSPLTWA